jgi:hypothetical protein
MLTPMIYAVIESMGHAYERAAIEQALQVRPGKSPITGLYYREEGSTLRTDFTLKLLCDRQVNSQRKL